MSINRVERNNQTAISLRALRGSALKRGARQGALLIVVVILIAYFGVLNSYFVTSQNIQNILLQATVVGILGIGQTYVVITGGIDLSIGSMVATAAVCSGIFSTHTSPIIAILGGIVVGAMAGLVNGLLIVSTKITPFIITLGTMGIYSGLALIITGGQAVYGIPSNFQHVLAGKAFGIPVPILLFAILTSLSVFVMKFTKFGEYLVAIGGNPEVATLAGISVRRVSAYAYIVSGSLAGLCGAILAARLGAADPNAGSDLLLVAIAATVMGGTKLAGGEGSMVGAAFGAILIATLTAGLTSLNVQAFYQKVAVGTAIILTILIDQFAKRRRR
jgi:ribose transport system permease protein